MIGLNNNLVQKIFRKLLGIDEPKQESKIRYPLQEGDFIPERCRCKYCDGLCIEASMIYDECVRCYFGKHPHLRQIQYKFEEYMTKYNLWTGVH